MQVRTVGTRRQVCSSNAARGREKRWTRAGLRSAGAHGGSDRGPRFRCVAVGGSGNLMAGRRPGRTRLVGGDRHRGPAGLSSPASALWRSPQRGLQGLDLARNRSPCCRPIRFSLGSHAIFELVHERREPSALRVLLMVPSQELGVHLSQHLATHGLDEHRRASMNRAVPGIRPGRSGRRAAPARSRPALRTRSPPVPPGARRPRHTADRRCWSAVPARCWPAVAPPASPDAGAAAAAPPVSRPGRRRAGRTPPGGRSCRGPR